MTEGISRHITVVNTYELIKNCDRCNARIKVKVKFHFDFLCFCQHHFKKLEEALVSDPDFQNTQETDAA